MKNETPKKSLLFVSIDFPPARTSGIYRPVFFTKYLIEAGWEVTLLTATAHLSGVSDTTLTREIHPDLDVIRISAPMPRKLTEKIYASFQKSAGQSRVSENRSSLRSRIFGTLKKHLLSPAFRIVDNFILVPDNYIIWSFKSFFKARRIIRKRKVSHLLVTSPPHSVQILGLLLRFFTGVRYITDFRNSWTDNQPYRYRLREKWEKYLERKVIFRSRAIINMSPGDIDRLLARMPDAPRDRMHVVTNGYNEREFGELDKATESNQSGPLRLLYVGSMYEHSGDSTAEALRILKGRGYTADDVVFSIIGFSDESFDRLVSEYGVTDMVDNRGFMPHIDLMRAYPVFDVMHLLTGGTPYYHTGALPGKIFEYMRLGKPILHAGIEGTTHEMLKESGLEIFVSLNDAPGIAGAITDLMARKKSTSLGMSPNRAYAESFEWRHLAEKVNSILTQVT